MSNTINESLTFGASVDSETLHYQFGDRHGTIEQSDLAHIEIERQVDTAALVCNFLGIIALNLEIQAMTYAGIAFFGVAIGFLINGRYDVRVVLKSGRRLLMAEDLTRKNARRIVKHLPTAAEA